MTIQTLIRPTDAGTMETTPTVTKRQILFGAAAILDARPPGSPPLKRFHSMERKSEEAQRALAIAGTPLQAIAASAATLGVPLTTGGEPATVAHLVDRGLITLPQAHSFSCICGHAIPDDQAASKMRDIAGQDQSGTA